MAAVNSFTTVSRRGFGSRLLSSIIGVPIGIILVFGSCILLYWNEGRVDYSKIAAQSTPVQASQVDQSENGKFVSVTGAVSTNQPIGDGAYLKPGNYVAVQRTVEEYAWTQQQQSSSTSSVGGSSTTKTTYTYSEQWTDQPADSSTFQVPQGHQNPPKALDDASVDAQAAQVGAYSFNPQTIKLPPLASVALNASDVTLPATTTSDATAGAAATASTTPTTTSSTSTSPLSDLTIASPQYIYGGSGSLQSPALGDIRISYQALADGTNATAFGQLSEGGSLGAYTNSNNHTLYDLLLGDRQTAINTLHSQYERTTWIIRGVGVLLIWIGLMMLFGPLDMLLDFIPIAGEIGGLITFIITLPIALLLGGTVIIIGYTTHHLITLVIVGPLVFIVWLGLLKLIKKIRGLPKRGSGGGGLPPQMSQPTAATPITPAVTSSGSLFAVTSSSAANNLPISQPPVRSAEPPAQPVIMASQPLAPPPPPQPANSPPAPAPTGEGAPESDDSPPPPPMPTVTVG